MVNEKMIEAAAREEIARIIDPHNFMVSGADYGVDQEGFKTTWAYLAQQVALTKADQIISALSTDAEPEMHARSFANIVDEKGKIELLVKDARAKALEEAAKVAETKGVHPELNIYDGGPAWYRHGKEIAKAIRALQSEER